MFRFFRRFRPSRPASQLLALTAAYDAALAADDAEHATDLMRRMVEERKNVVHEIRRNREVVCGVEHYVGGW